VIWKERDGNSIRVVGRTTAFPFGSEDPMLTGLQIQNFRSLRNTSVSKLKRLNLITGRNAGGKTSLLEAVFLNAGAANASLLFSINTFRGDAVLHPETDRVFSTCFSDLDVRKTIILSADERRQLKSRSRVLTITGQTNTQVKLGQSRPSTFLSGVQMRFEGPNGSSTSSASLDFPTDPSAVIPAGQILLPVKVSGGPKPKDVIFGQFLSPYIRDAYQETYNSLTAVIKEKGLAEILRTLELIQAKVKGLEALTEQGQPMIYVDTGGPKLLPASVLGAGFFHILRLALSMSQIDRGILLVDELEDGLHYKTFPRVVSTIIEFLQTRTDTQAFIATHSAELIDAALEAAKVSDFHDFCLLNLIATPEGNQIRYFDPEEIAFAKDLDAELR
jgi:predicted ATPase